MLYLILILIANVLIVGANVLYSLFAQSSGMSLLTAIFTAPFLTVCVIAVDGSAAYIIRKLPSNWFSVDSKLSRVSKRESELYRRTGVRRWRDKIPELGMFTGFHKDRVYEPTNNEYLKRFVLEANYGAIIHFVSIPLGFMIIFFAPIKYALNFAVPVAIVNAVLNLMPAFVLRYNVPKLQTLMKINDRRMKRNSNVDHDCRIND